MRKTWTTAPSQSYNAPIVTRAMPPGRLPSDLLSAAPEFDFDSLVAAHNGLSEQVAVLTDAKPSSVTSSIAITFTGGATQSISRPTGAKALYVTIDASGGSITLTLPKCATMYDATGINSCVLFVTRVDTVSANTVTLSPASGDLIAGQSTRTLTEAPAGTTEGESLQMFPGTLTNYTIV